MTKEYEPKANGLPIESTRPAGKKRLDGEAWVVIVSSLVVVTSMVLGVVCLFASYV